MNNKPISAKDTDAYVAAQPDASGIFNRHAELSAVRTVSGFDRAWTIWRRGKWHAHQGSMFSSARLKCLIQRFGVQTHNIMWDFPEGIETPEGKEARRRQTIVELGFGQYVEA